jgi:SAM-dependent methyltransferase
MPGGEFHTGPAEILPFPDGRYDLVTCLGSLEHFLDQPAALAEMVRVMKPRGKVVILVPNAGFLTYRLGLYKGTQQQAVRETIRPLSEWQEMLNASGLVVKERWKDLHVLNKRWIFRAPWSLMPLRLLQAIALTFWPLHWQYQVYHLCERIPVDKTFKAVT